MMRPPKRSVRAPTGMRPTDPTTTGTATRRDWENDDRPSESLSPAASGDSRAQAQKFTANPAVAMASIHQARLGTADAAEPAEPPAVRGAWSCVVVIAFSVPARLRGSLVGALCPASELST